MGGAVDKDFSSMRAAIKYVEGMTVLEVYPALNALDYKNKCPLCEAGLKPTKKHGITFTKPDGSQVVGMVSEQLYNAIGRAAKAGPGVTRIPSRRSEKWKRFRRWLHFTRWTMPWHLFKPVNFEGDHWMQDKVSYVGGVKVISIECSCGRVF